MELFQCAVACCSLYTVAADTRTVPLEGAPKTEIPTKPDPSLIAESGKLGATPSRGLYGDRHPVCISTAFNQAEFSLR